MQLIARATPSGVPSAVFTNVPQGFRHLIVTVSNGGVAIAQRATVNVGFNDSGTGYPYAAAWEAIIGGATTTNSGTNGTNSSLGAGLSLNLISNQNTYAATVHIMDYSNTSKFKSVLKQSGSATGNSNDIIGTDLVASAWENLAAITKVSVAFGGYDILAGTVISLYGVA